MRKRYLLKEITSFIRIENGLFIGGISVSGFLIFNSMDMAIFPLFLAMFLGTGASYAYNYLKDKREDLVNKKRLNKFVTENNKGNTIVISLYILGFISALCLSSLAIMTYLALIGLSLVYSGKTRIKEKFLIKNFYTGLSISFSFVVGALALGNLCPSLLSYVFIVFILGFTANLLGDIRGLRGDETIGMLTLPMMLDLHRTKGIIYSLLLFLLALIFLFGVPSLYPVVPFIIAAVFTLSKNRLRECRIFMLSSFTLLPVLLFMMDIIGGV